MDPAVKEKYLTLQAILRRWQRTAIAYSGGVDSSLLAYAALTAIGADNTLLVHGHSCLASKHAEEAAQAFIDVNLKCAPRYRIVAITPLEDPLFVVNDRKRCYICKKLLYGTLLKTIAQEHFTRLADGTNCDDLRLDRPGLQAGKELGVRTPLVEAGFSKADIRSAAAALHLGNAERPADSCLATRIDTGDAINEERLRTIEVLESFLLNSGYFGCRVKPRGQMVIISVEKKYFPTITAPGERERVTTFFTNYGFKDVVLDLFGR